MPEWLIPIFVGLVILALFGLAHWYFEVYTVRKHWREAEAEADAMMAWRFGPDWRERTKRGEIPPDRGSADGVPASDGGQKP